MLGNQTWPGTTLAIVITHNIDNTSPTKQEWRDKKKRVQEFQKGDFTGSYLSFKTSFKNRKPGKVM